MYVYVHVHVTYTYTVRNVHYLHAGSDPPLRILYAERVRK